MKKVARMSVKTIRTWSLVLMPLTVLRFVVFGLNTWVTFSTFEAIFIFLLGYVLPPISLICSIAARFLAKTRLRVALILLAVPTLLLVLPWIFILLYSFFYEVFLWLQGI